MVAKFSRVFVLALFCLVVSTAFADYFAPRPGHVFRVRDTRPGCFYATGINVDGGVVVLSVKAGLVVFNTRNLTFIDEIPSKRLYNFIEAAVPCVPVTVFDGVSWNRTYAGPNLLPMSYAPALTPAPAADYSGYYGGSDSSGKTVHVSGYTNSHGTYVQSYDRRPPSH